MSGNRKPCISVLGGLSKQGRSVATSLLQSNRYDVQIFSRNVTSSLAEEFERMGAKLVNLPLQLGYKDKLVQALEGSRGVFMLTPPVAPPEDFETALGMEMADAAVEAGVDHIVFSSLEHVERITGGQKWAPHFTDKARIEDYIRSLPVRSSFILMAFFYTNILEYYPPRIERDRIVLPIYLPGDFRTAFVDPLTATGPAVLEIFDHPEIYSGKSLPVIGDILSPQEMVQTFMDVTGKKAVYEPAYEKDDFLRNFPDFAGNDMLVHEIMDMVSYSVEYGYYKDGRDLTWSRRIDPDCLTWEQFLKSSKWQGEKRSFGM